MTTVASGLVHPWALTFLPDGNILVTERPGRLRLVSQGSLDPRPIGGVPDVVARDQGGLLDVTLDPDFETNHLVYLSYAAERPSAWDEVLSAASFGLVKGGAATTVGRGRLVGHKLEDFRVIFRSNGVTRADHHFGSRMRFDRDGSLIVTLGDRGDPELAQSLLSHAGKVLRMDSNGAAPAENPLLNGSNALPEIFTAGHRNPQGLAIHPSTGEIWIHEHGPQGGDEINVLRGGANYGWPVVTFGREYGTGAQIGVGTHLAGMEDPIYHWSPSIAPSGMMFYDGNVFARWRGQLFIGGLKSQTLVRLKIDGHRVVEETRMLSGEHGRIRDVCAGPDGLIYFVTDDQSGALYRLEPTHPTAHP